MKKLYFSALIFISVFIISQSTWSQTSNWTPVGPVSFPTNEISAINGIGRVPQIKFDPNITTRMYAVSAHSLFVSNDNSNSWAVVAGVDDMPYSDCASICIDNTNSNVLYLGTGDPNYYSTTAASGVWKSNDGGLTFNQSSTGMGNKLVLEIIMSPTDHNTLVAATNVGIYRTTDGGANWVLSSPVDDFTSMCMKPGDNGTIYAVCKAKKQYHQDFYRSTDFGITWTINRLSDVLDSNCGRVTVSAADPNVVYVGFLGVNSYKYGGIIYKSTDSGLTFTMQKGETTPSLGAYNPSYGLTHDTQGSELDPQGGYNWDIVADPLDANTLYTCAHCICKSTDSGVTWAQIQTSWSVGVHTDQHDLIFNPNNPDQLFNGNDGGVWLNTNHAATNTWTPKSDGLAATEIYTKSFANSRITKNLMSIGTQDNGEMYYKDGIWRSSRTGDHNSRMYFDNANANRVYYAAGQGTTTASRRDLVAAPTTSIPLAVPGATSNSDFYVFSEQDGKIGFYAKGSTTTATNGLYFTTNLQASTPDWVTMNGFVPTSQIMAVAASPGDANVVYVVSKDKKVVRSGNALAGASAQFTEVTSLPMPSSLPTNNCISIFRSGVVYASSNGYVYRSDDQGATWTAVGNGPVTTTLNGQKILTLIADVDNSVNEAVYVNTSQGIYYKDNTLADWAYFTTNLPSTIGYNVLDIFHDKNNPTNNRLRAATYGRGLWETPIANSVGTLPTVAITNPLDGGSAAEGNNIQIDATANDADGSITKVEFLLDGVVVGVDTVAPYSFTLNNIQHGLHGITARATDNTMNQTTSAPVSVYVNTVIAIADAYVRDGSNATLNYGTEAGLDLKTESVSFNREVFLKFDLSTLPAGFNRATLNLNVNFGNTGTNTTQWEVYYVPTDSWAENTITWNTKPAGTKLLGTITGQKSGVAVWNIAPQVMAEYTGDKILSLRLVSTVAGSTTNATFDSKEALINTVKPQLTVFTRPNEGPTVAITSPVSNEDIPGPGAVTINVAASDIDGTVTKVEFFNDATKLGEDLTAPYSFNWTNVPLGQYTITAKATDNSGVTTVSSPVTFSVKVFDNLLPIADSYVRDGASAALNFGTANTVVVKKDGSGFSRITFLKFDLSQYTGNPDTAKLKLTSQLSNSAATSLQFQLWYCTNDAWTETGINWNNMPATITMLGSQAGKATGTSMEWDILNQLKAEIGGDKILTLAIVTPVINTSGDINFYSKEATVSQTLMPQIIVNSKPQIALISPVNAAVIDEGTPITLSATATDDRGVSTVKFLVDGIEKTTITQSPYTWDSPGLQPGLHVITARATDASGLTTDAIANITVRDITAPVIICPENIVLNNDQNQCGAVATFAATATDNFSTVTITYNQESGSLFPKGITTVVATATDAAGNVSTCSFDITVNDITAPVATVQELPVLTEQCSVSAVTAPTATDNCAGTILGTTTDATTFATQGNYTIHWTYDDGNGNTSTQDQTVIVDDTTVPVAEVQTLTTVTGQCNASVTTAPTATDNCAGTILGTTTDVTTFDAQGTYTIHWHYDDGNGNTTTQDQTVVVQDTSAPTIICPENITLSACESTATWSVPAVSGGCPNVTATQTAGPASGSTFASGTSTTISYAVSNGSGIVTDTCSFTVTRQSALDVTVSNSNPQLYYGYSLDQSTVITGIPTGGVGPYIVSITMDRPLKLNVINASGDEILTTDPTTNSVTATLMENATFTVTVTDANGCSVSKNTTVYSEDARCFSNNTDNTKVKICHTTGISNDPCHELCVAQSSVQAHLDHGDFLGTCTSNCIQSVPLNLKIDQKEVVDVSSAFKVIVYPNPSNQQFTLALEGGSNEKVELSLYDILGRKLKQISRTAEQPILFGEELPAGEYLLVVKQGDNVKTVNLIKK